MEQAGGHRPLGPALAGAWATVTLRALPRRLPDGGEHDVVGEEGNPLDGGDAVGRGAADQFVLAAGLFHQFGLAELADDLKAVALRNQIF